MTRPSVGGHPANADCLTENGRRFTTLTEVGDIKTKATSPKLRETSPAKSLWWEGGRESMGERFVYKM